ncbi:hypothetical protein U0070_013720 [Myodes glareolus]|uniref:Uncharacterized protein n=1 Tax=Myodes glareolus TaxID=447135 RepID=A0AAW0H535_MYOGA
MNKLLKALRGSLSHVQASTSSTGKYLIYVVSKQTVSASVPLSEQTWDALLLQDQQLRVLLLSHTGHSPLASCCSIPNTENGNDHLLLKPISLESLLGVLLLLGSHILSCPLTSGDKEQLSSSMVSYGASRRIRESTWPGTTTAAHASDLTDDFTATLDLVPGGEDVQQGWEIQGENRKKLGGERVDRTNLLGFIPPGAQSSGGSSKLQELMGIKLLAMEQLNGVSEQRRKENCHLGHKERFVMSTGGLGEALGISGPLPGYEQEATVSECSLQPHSLTLASDLSRYHSLSPGIGESKAAEALLSSEDKGTSCFCAKYRENKFFRKCLGDYRQESPMKQVDKSGQAVVGHIKTWLTESTLSTPSAEALYNRRVIYGHFRELQSLQFRVFKSESSIHLITTLSASRSKLPTSLLSRQHGSCPHYPHGDSKGGRAMIGEDSGIMDNRVLPFCTSRSPRIQLSEEHFNSVHGLISPSHLPPANLHEQTKEKGIKIIFLSRYVPLEGSMEKMVQDTALLMGKLQLSDAHRVQGYGSPFHLSVCNVTMGTKCAPIGSVPFKAHQQLCSILPGHILTP